MTEPEETESVLSRSASIDARSVLETTLAARSRLTTYVSDVFARPVSSRRRAAASKQLSVHGSSVARVTEQRLVDAHRA